MSDAAPPPPPEPGPQQPYVPPAYGPGHGPPQGPPYGTAYGPAYGPTPPYYGYPPGYVSPEFDPFAKSKVVAGILGIVLGGFGIHRFYLGFTTIGILQIVVTLLTCGLGALWGFVEGILYLVGASGFTTDSTGRPLKN
jgi:TM2 domain-containing membrane protein YozV